MSKRRDKFGKIILNPGRPKACNVAPLSKHCFQEQSFVKRRKEVREILHFAINSIGKIIEIKGTEEVEVPMTMEEQRIYNSPRNPICRNCRYNMRKNIFQK
jgi:hypothetical protein